MFINLYNCLKNGWQSIPLLIFNSETTINWTTINYNYNYNLTIY